MSATPALAQRDPTGAPHAAVLAVRDLHVAFPAPGGKLAVVDGISYDLALGRTLGIVGESGCGKTMTALAVMGLVPRPGVVSGSIALAGAELLAFTEPKWERVRGDRIAMVFQEPATALNPAMTIGRQIAEAMVYHERLSWRRALARAVDLLDAVGIASPRERAGAYPHQMSGGMRQRAMIAIALACRPAVLIADEPTTALDVTIQAQILDLMRGLQREIGMAIQFISHNLAVVSEVADEIAVMYAGRIVERAPAAALFAEPLHPYTQGLIATLPDPDRRADRLPVIEGTLARSTAERGCRFAPRCPYADAECRAEDPQLRAVGPGHVVACIKVAA